MIINKSILCYNIHMTVVHYPYDNIIKILNSSENGTVGKFNRNGIASQDAHHHRFIGLWRLKVVDSNLQCLICYRDFPIKTIA